MKFIFTIIVFLVLFSFQKKKEKITRLNKPVLFEKTTEIVPHYIEFNDTIPSDTLYEYIDHNKMPLMYSRKILTGVCIEGKCRLVNINLYWHVTGRYLGYELPEGEFLSKTEHHPFKKDEYDRLHALLADPQSALSQYSIEELVPKKDSTKNKVDAVSTATIAAVLDYIVKGAVYTTYTLWHTVYGPTQREVELMTTKNLTEPLVVQLLNSESLTDQVWALNHITEKVKVTPRLQNRIFEFISGEDVYLAERALNALPKDLLSSDETQMQLTAVFQETTFLKKRLILQSLKDAAVFHDSAIKIFCNHLPGLSGTLIKDFMELLIRFEVNEKQIVAEVEALLKNENRYIANQALKYLESLENPDKKTVRRIEKYRKKNNL